MALNLLNSIQLKKPGKNLFDLTHDVKLSLNLGELVPVMAMECVPGDKIRLGVESLLRFAPMVSPVMHRYDSRIEYFFVPSRLLWSNWEEFITGVNPSTGGPSTAAFPFVNLDSATYSQRLCDYLGLPDPGAINTIPVSALPFAAYQMIYNCYYRDQNLLAEVDYKLDNGNNTTKNGLFELRRRAWEHDYFTSALPTAQLGGAVDIPLNIELDPEWHTKGNIPVFQDSTGGILDGTVDSNVVGDITVSAEEVAYNPKGSLVNDTTISDLRRAFRLQEWLELAKRGGSRYVEHIRSFFGVHSSDKRLQRPEYIVGAKTPVTISEVLNTAGFDNGTDALPQGNMAGHGVSVTSGKMGSYFCEEHGYVIGIMSVIPKSAYFQGVPKHFLKIDDRFQYYYPQFAHIGEQEILNKELYAEALSLDEVFGYIPRYTEYKYMPSRVAGDFKTTLDFWQHARKFDSLPALSQEFVECNPDHRIFAVTDPAQQKLYAHVLNKVMAARPMAKYGNPGI